MATAAAFSRLQLAAALIEYDNDLDDPEVPKRSAQESAIFAHLRKNPAARPDIGRRKSDFLGVSLPSEGGTAIGRDSTTMAGTRRSRRISKASTLAMRNPFGVDGQTELDLNEEDEEEELEVDLQSWGLDAFMPKDKKSAKTKGKEPAGSVRSKMAPPEHDVPAATRGRGVVTSRSMNLEGQFEFENATIVDRRRSFGSPLELVGAEEHEHEMPRRRAASRASLLSHADPTSLLPFPTSPVRSPTPDMDTPLANHARLPQDRRYSTASLGSRFALDSPEPLEHRQRQQSMTSIGIGMLFSEEEEENNPFAIERPAATSRFDPKAPASERPRSHSNASLGSRMMLENDAVSTMTGDPYPRDRPYSTMELLRPKVLVMPSPLQSVTTNVEPPPAHRVVEGFESTKDGPPLPPGARATRRLSASLGSGPLASNAFTPNPMMDLTPSQQIFRNTLVVGGQSPHLDLDIPRATEDGEQIVLDPVVPEIVVPPVVEEPPTKNGRPAGKLYGRSLIDDLEARKQQMRGKQRVFRGDERPSMMARASSTFIDPASLKTGPQRTSVFDPQANLTRRGSQNVKPLLTFDSEENVAGNKLSPGAVRAQGARSVFGTDTLWEREMEKLKLIQAREAEEAEERRKREAEEELKKDKKGKKKKKGKGSPEIEQPLAAPEHTAIEPPTLPDIQRASTRRPPPKPSDLDEESESDEDEDDEVPVQKTHRTSESWHAGASDEEEDGPRRTTGVGPRYPSQRRKPATALSPDDDSEEDLPLAATVHKAIARATMAAYSQDESDDEDKPLAQVIQKVQTSPRRPQPSTLQVNRGDGSDDDDQPLGLRASRMMPTTQGGDKDEDDMPLAFHPEQQRRTQYQMFAQQAQQQQQMMMQAQMQSNMYMNAQASMMGSLYGVPPMMGPMPMMPMQVPIPIPSPPPMVDEAKFGRVDRWRRDVAVDGEN